MRISLLAVLMLISGALSAPGSRGPAAPPQETAVVEVAAERFAFTPSEIRVKTGMRVEFRLKSDDTDHGFRIIGTGINVRIPKRGRGTATVEFVPAQAGRYTFECSRLCGAGHSFMRGTLIVTD